MASAPLSHRWLSGAEAMSLLKPKKAVAHAARAPQPFLALNYLVDGEAINHLSGLLSGLIDLGR